MTAGKGHMINHSQLQFGPSSCTANADAILSVQGTTPLPGLPDNSHWLQMHLYNYTAITLSVIILTSITVTDIVSPG